MTTQARDWESVWFGFWIVLVGHVEVDTQTAISRRQKLFHSQHSDVDVVFIRLIFTGYLQELLTAKNRPALSFLQNDCIH